MSIQQRLRNDEILLLDGAVGTELERRGFSTTLPLWSAAAAVEAPELLLEIHMDYVDAGADILTANTFRTTDYALKGSRFGEASKMLTRASIDIARNASNMVERPVFVGASLAPLEDCYRPDLTPDVVTIQAHYQNQIENIIEASPDIIMLETMINLAEVDVATRILCDTQFPYLISFTTDPTGNLLDGTALNQVVDLLDDRNPLGIMLNCRAPEVLTGVMDDLRQHFNGCLGIYANGVGEPGGLRGWQWNNSRQSIEEYIVQSKRWLEMGVNIIGGCCGTGPDHITALRTLIDATTTDLQ